MYIHTKYHSNQLLCLYTYIFQQRWIYNLHLQVNILYLCLCLHIIYNILSLLCVSNMQQLANRMARQSAIKAATDRANADREERRRKLYESKKFVYDSKRMEADLTKQQARRINEKIIQDKLGILYIHYIIYLVYHIIL